MASGYVSDKVTRFDSKAVETAIKKCGIPKGKLSTMVLGRDASYLSNATIQGKCNKEDLKKLCEFISLDYNAIVIVDEPKPQPAEKRQSVGNDANIDLLIVGLKNLCEIEQANGAKLDAILTEIRGTNTKLNRIENAVGQAVSNVIEVKNTTNANNTILKDLKSTGAVISGRLRDMVAKFK